MVSFRNLFNQRNIKKTNRTVVLNIERDLHMILKKEKNMKFECFYLTIIFDL